MVKADDLSFEWETPGGRELRERISMRSFTPGGKTKIYT